MRGKLYFDVSISCGVRITPACAGKTPSYVPQTHDHRDHPRVCGENAESQCKNHRQKGSPPRVRGKPSMLVLAKQGKRITPACAGKTSLQSYRSSLQKDHPRVCGENLDIGPIDCLLEGSPPRVRGKLPSHPCFQMQYRITPACAGKTAT